MDISLVAASASLSVREIILILSKASDEFEINSRKKI